jgi:hypothetical protein
MPWGTRRVVLATVAPETIGFDASSIVDRVGKLASSAIAAGKVTKFAL